MLSAHEYHDGLYRGLRHFPDRFKGVCKKNPALFVALFQFNDSHGDLPPLSFFEALVSTLIGGRACKSVS